jgi:hypothetical protein
MGGSMPMDGHRYAIEFYTKDWKRLGRQGVVVDIEPARECARLELLRGSHDTTGAAADPGRIVPRWSAKLGAPYIEGFRIETDRGDGGPAHVDFPSTYFRETAQNAAARFVREGSLQELEAFRYLVMAFPVEPEAPQPAGAAPGSAAGSGRRLTVRRQSAPLALVESPLALMRATASETGELDPTDVPVFLPEEMLREVERRGREAGGAETGGILIGHLHHDRDLPELFVEITAHVLARHVQASMDRLTFTPETWLDLETTLAQRAAGEVMLGWWHSHPVGRWKESGPPEKQEQEVEAQAEGFLSTHDRMLHRTVFTGAYCVALVVTDPGHRDPTSALFGWRRGMLVRRGYYVRTGRGQPPRREGPDEQSAPSRLEGVHHD